MGVISMGPSYRTVPTIREPRCFIGGVLVDGGGPEGVRFQ